MFGLNEKVFGGMMQGSKRGSGVIGVLALGVVGLLALIIMASARPPLPSSGYSPVVVAPLQAGGAGGIQDVYIRALDVGVYDQPYVRVQAGQPVRLHFSADARSGCGRALVMRDFGVSLVSRSGEEQTVEFTPQAGKYEYSCSMRMFRGTLEAV